MQDPAAEPSADKPADKPAEATADKPAEPPAPTTDKPAEQPADKPADAAAPSTPDLGAAAGVTSDKPGTMPMRTKTFEEAKEDVARSMAMNVVREQLQAKLTKIESEMNRYSSEVQMERVSRENNVKPENPVKPVDLKKLAESEGLQYGSTGMSDGFRLASSSIGRSMIGNQSLVNSIMNPNVELYRPIRSMFIDMATLLNLISKSLFHGRSRTSPPTRQTSLKCAMRSSKLGAIVKLASWPVKRPMPWLRKFAKVAKSLGRPCSIRNSKRSCSVLHRLLG